MQKQHRVIIIGAVLVFFVGVGLLTKTDDIRGFDEALMARYDSYEGALSYARDTAKTPCTPDGLGIRPVMFGTLVSWCDATWFYGSGLLMQVSGSWITRADVSQYLAIPNELEAKEILRNMRSLVVAGESFEDMDRDDDPFLSLTSNVITLARDWGEQRVYPEQIGQARTIGEVTVLTVLQKNVNTPLVDMPNGALVEFAGIIARQGSGPWAVLLDMKSYVQTPDGSPWLMSPNVETVRFEGDELYVDILEGAGAGSGEGTLVRVQYDFEDTGQFLLWKPLGELYYVPETFSWDKSWDMLSPITTQKPASDVTL